MNWRRVLAIARSEWLLNRRDPRSMVIIFGLPVVLLILYGHGLNFDLENIPVAVQDLDRSEVSRELIRRAAASGHFRLMSEIADDAEIAALLRSREALMVIVIPPRFSEQVASGEKAEVELVTDGSDPTSAGTAIGYMQGLVGRMGEEIARGRALGSGQARALAEGIEVRLQVLYNPGLQSAAYIIPGLIGVVMALMTALLTSTCIVREREVGTIEALLATPVRSAEVIVGKLLPYAVLSLVDVGLCIGTGALMFGVLPRGSMVQLVLFSGVFIFACLSLGLLISGLASSQRIAIVGGLMTLMLPTILLSGFVFPIASMPAALRAVSNILPATHYLVGMRAVYLRGVSVTVFWPNMLALLALTAAIFALAVRSFRGRL